MNKKIIFTNILGVPEEYAPVPASKIIPEWYVKLDSYIGGEKRPDGNANTTATAKRCMPIFDSISTGYIIFTHSDLFVSQQEDEDGKISPYYEWSNFDAIAFHSIKQLPVHPENKGHEFSYPKWNNAWAISTPPGYSTLFISPLHRETPIVALPGIVDTDLYPSPVNFPFVLKDAKMEGLIPAGTPIVQVIPFKRDEFEMTLGGIEEIEKHNKTVKKLRARFFDSYKNQFRSNKSYR